MTTFRPLRTGLLVMFVLMISDARFPPPQPSPTGLAPAQGPLLAVADLPLAFEPSGRELPGELLYTARATRYGVGLHSRGVQLRLADSSNAESVSPLGISFVNTKGARSVSADQPLPGLSHYFVGTDPARWRQNVPHFARVRYDDVYPDIDAVFYGRDHHLEYDFVVAPGADPSQIALQVEGADEVRVDEAGDLRISVDGIAFVQRRPVAYQVLGDSSHRAVDVGYRLEADGTVGLVVARYDPQATLVIDPVLVYSTYLGGSGLEFPAGPSSFASPVAVDADGNLIVVGSTASTDFPSAGAAPSGTNLFVAKFNASGSALLFATYLGGTGDEDHASVALDEGGAIYISGNTFSSDLPVTGGSYQSSPGGGADAFVAKLTGSGSSISFLTYLGGTGDESVEDIAVNAAGNAFVTGSTNSPNFPTPVGYQKTKGTSYDAFVAKFNPAGTNLVFSTYLGGSDVDSAFGIAVDDSDAVYLSGQTYSSDFPLASAVQPDLHGAGDAFVTKLAASGGTLVYSTYLGGSGPTAESAKLAIDAAGNAYVAGFTTSSDFPPGAAPPAQASLGGLLDVFVAKLNVTGSAILYRTFLGGTGYDVAWGIDVDTYGNAYVTGHTTSADFPTAGQAWDTMLGGAQDAFVAKLGPTGSAFKYSSYLGGDGGSASGSDHGVGVAVDAQGNAYVAGWASSTNFTANAGGATVLHPDLGGTTDAFATKIGYEDDDNDGLPDDWEENNGLNPNDGTGANGASGDPDNDGSNNGAEYTGGTSPTSAFVRYFAEGATSSFFDDQIALANPSSTQTASVVMRFRTNAGGTPIEHTVSVGPMTRVSVAPKTDVAGLENAEFSTEVRSNITVVADRTMRWDATGYGSHAETSIASPSDTWYLAEGATTGGFSLFYLVQNPNDTVANVTVRYLLAGGAPPIVKTYAVSANSRFNIWVNTIPGLGAAEVSAVLTTSPSTPIIVERAMYLNSQGQLFGAGHNSAGVTSPALSWFLAEGATGPYFDLFLLVANPNATAANVQANYLLPSGQNVVRTYQVPPNSRFNIWVDTEPGLSNVEVSTTLTSTNNVPIIVERAMWWPTDYTQWFEAHNSPGATQTGTKWALAEGEVGGTPDNDTYVLVANTSDFAASVKVTLLFEDGTTAARTYAIEAKRRFNIWVRNDFAAAVGAGRKFGTLVESQGATPAQIVVERAQYSNAGGIVWAAGTNALATRLQ